jgi:general nucleoside transport system permease protein
MNFSFSDLLTLAAMTAMAGAAVRIATPLLLAALGEAISERAGVLNVGIEGIMALGALTGFIVSYWSGDLWVGFGGALLIGAAAGLAFGVLTVLWGADQVATGIIANLFCLGLANLAYRSLFTGARTIPAIKNMPPYRVPYLSSIDYVGRALFSQTVITYIAFLMVPVCWFLLQRTIWGLNVRAVGENPGAVDTAGLDVWTLRLSAVTIGGAFAGVAGATLSIAQLGAYLDNMTAGRGFVALAVVVFGGWNPWRIAGACLIFGLAEAIQLRMQAMGIPVPSALLTAVPYVLTIIVITAFAGTASYPAAMNQPYLRRAKHAIQAMVGASPVGVSEHSTATASPQSTTDETSVSNLPAPKRMTS